MRNKETILMKDSDGYIKKQEFDILMTGTKSEEEYFLVGLMWYTAGRITEILSLRPNRFGWKNDHIIMDNLKRDTRQVKTIPMNYWEDSFKKKLEAFVSKFGPKELIFKFSRFTAIRKLRKVGGRVGIEKIGKRRIHPHMFRHGLAIWLTQHRQPLAVAQRILGHSSIMTTGFYQRYSGDDIRDSLEKLKELKD